MKIIARVITFVLRGISTAAVVYMNFHIISYVHHAAARLLTRFYLAVSSLGWFLFLWRAPAATPCYIYYSGAESVRFL